MTSNTEISNKLKKIYNQLLLREHERMFRPALRLVSRCDRLDLPETLILKFQLLHLVTTHILRFAVTGSETYQQAVTQKEVLADLLWLIDSYKREKGEAQFSAFLATALWGLVGFGITKLADPHADFSGRLIFGSIGGFASILSIPFIRRSWKSIKLIREKIAERERLLPQLQVFTLEAEAKVSYHVQYILADTNPLVLRNMLRVVSNMLENPQTLICTICHQSETAEDEAAEAIQIIVTDSKATPLVSEESKRVAHEVAELPRELSYALTETNNLTGPYCTPCIHTHLVQQSVTAEALEEKSIAVVKDPKTKEPLLLDSLGRVKLLPKSAIEGEWDYLQRTYSKLFQPAVTIPPAPTPTIISTTTSASTLPTQSTAPTLSTTTATTTTSAVTTTISMTASSSSLFSTLAARVRDLRVNRFSRRLPQQPPVPAAIDLVLNNGDDDSPTSTGYQLLSSGSGSSR